MRLREVESENARLRGQLVQAEAMMAAQETSAELRALLDTKQAQAILPNFRP